MAFQCSLEQISFDSRSLNADSVSIDSLGSVVDANVDFKSVDKIRPKNSVMEPEQVIEEWKSVATNEIETVANSVSKSSDLDEKVSDSEKTSEPVYQNTDDPIYDEANAAFSYDSFEGCSYPKIPFSVAQELNKNNPEWCTEAEKYMSTKILDSSDSVVSFENDSVLNRKLPLFKAMAASSEALSLQHSVIGNHEIKPVSPDIVADTMLRLQQQKLGDSIITNDEKRETVSTDSNLCKDSAYAAKTVMKLNQSSMPMSSNIVSAEIEKEKPRKSSRYSSRKGSRTQNNKIPIVHKSRKSSINIYENYNHADSETESCFSDRHDLESVTSDIFETESNLSETSHLNTDDLQDYKISSTSLPINNQDEKIQELARINEIPSGQTSKLNPRYIYSQNTFVLRKDQWTETEDSEMFVLMRAKANLEGKLESVTKNEVDLHKESLAMKTTITSLQSQLQAVTNQFETTFAEKQRALRDLDMQIKQQERWDSVIKDYQNIIEAKNLDIKSLKEDLMEVEQAHTQTRINHKELKVDLDSKDGAIFGLKKKIAELHVELQGLMQGKVQLNNKVENEKHEITALTKSNDWYREQLHTAQDSRNKLHQELINLQSENVSFRNDLEKTRNETNHLKLQLAESQHRAVSEKELLMNHLESIEADMKERESLFDEIQRDKGTVEHTLMERAKRMEEEHSKLTQLKFNMSDLEYQLNASKEDATEKEKLLASIEKDKVELVKQVTMLQKMVHSKDLEVQQYKQELKDSERTTKHIEMSLSTTQELAGKLKEEKTAADVALTAANEEKRIIFDSLKGLKENLNQVENNFKHMKAELVAKTSKKEQLMKEKYVLEDLLKKAEDNALLQQKEFESQLQNQNKNQHVLVDDIKKQKTEIEKVLHVYNRDLLSNQQVIKQLKMEQSGLIDTISQLQASNRISNEKISILNEEKAALLQKIAHQNELQIESEEKEFVEVQQNSVETDVTLDMNNEELNKLDPDLLQNSEIENDVTKAEKDTETGTEIPHELLEEERKRTSDLESQLQHALEKLNEAKDEIKKNQEIIIELEKEIGKISAITDSNNMLKQKNEELEKILSDKEVAITELSHRLKDLETKLYNENNSDRSRVSSLEEQLRKEQTVIKGLRVQVLKEKRNNQHMQRELTTLINGLEQANQTADSRKAEITAFQYELEAKIENQLKHRGEIEKMQTEICQQKAETVKLQRELEEVKARDPALAEQIKSLSWHLKEKRNKITALQEKEKVLEERHNLEVEGLKKAIQNLSNEMETYKSELVKIKKEKFKYQSQFAELRKAFKSSFNKPKPNSGEANNNQQLLDETYIQNLLQKSVQVMESRPLNQLQSCLNSLKQEMAELQKQLCDDEPKSNTTKSTST